MADDRKCLYCGRIDTMQNKRADAKFCNSTCRQNWHRRQNGVQKRQMYHRIKAGCIEEWIAFCRVEPQSVQTIENALRGLAMRAHIPINEDIIKQTEEAYRSLGK